VFSTQLTRIDHAWHVVAVGFAVSLLTAGTRFATGPFMESMMEAFDLSRTQFSTVVAVSLLVYGLCMPLAGRMADLLGGRVVLAAGGLLLSLSLVVSAMTTSRTVFILFFAIIASLGFSATSHVALSSVIGRWFVRRRGLAMTFLSSGAMSGMAIMVPLSAALISQIGWRETMLVFAAVILGVVLLGAIVLGGQTPDGGQVAGSPGADRTAWRAALGTSAFWMLAISFFACGFSMNLLGTHGVPMLEGHGFSTMTSAYGIGLIGLVSVFGSLVIGFTSDKIGRRSLLALIYGVRGLGFLGLMFVGLEWELYMVAAIGGLVWSGSSAMTSALTADLFGARTVGTLFGLIFVSHQIGAAAGSYLGGWAFDTHGSYLIPFVLTSVLLFVAAYISLQLPRNHSVVAAPATPASI
jgi:MFS family permease